jgi:hypothetical protein
MLRLRSGLAGESGRVALGVTDLEIEYFMLPPLACRCLERCRDDSLIFQHKFDVGLVLGRPD